MLTAIVAVIALGGCSGDDASPISVGEVTTETVVEVVEAPANVVAAATAVVDSPATGTVRTVRVSDGQRVRRGDVLLVVDSPETEQALAQAQQAAASAPAPVDLPEAGADASVAAANEAAQQAFDQARETARQIPDRATRQQALQQIAIAEAQVNAAQAQAQATVSQINQGIASLEQSLGAVTSAQGAQAQAAVAVAQRAVDNLVVKAPISGRVVIGPSQGSAGASSDLSGLAGQLPGSLAGQAESLLGGGGSGGGSSTGTLQAGSPVSSGDPLLTITDVSTLTLRSEVDETDILLVRKGVRADVELDAVPGAVYAAVVRNVDLSPSAGSGAGVSYVVRLDLGGGTTADGSPAPRPRPGMSAVALLRVDTAKDVPAVPVSAVFRDGDLDSVWVVEDGEATARTVTLGAQGEDYLEILDGVQVGDRDRCAWGGPGLRGAAGPVSGALPSRPSMSRVSMSWGKRRVQALRGVEPAVRSR